VLLCRCVLALSCFAQLFPAAETAWHSLSTTTLFRAMERRYDCFVLMLELA
jgi:hypothetical protein